MINCCHLTEFIPADLVTSYLFRLILSISSCCSGLMALTLSGDVWLIHGGSGVGNWRDLWRNTSTGILKRPHWDTGERRAGGE